MSGRRRNIGGRAGGADHGHAANRAPQRPAQAASAGAGARIYAEAALLVIAFAGFAVSLYLTFMHYRGAVPRCYVFSGCDVVQTSTYSVMVGVPVALPGAIYFALMFYLGIALVTRYGPGVAIAFRSLAYLGALAAVPLFLIQALVLKAFCFYCVTTEVLMLLIWVISFALPVRRFLSGPNIEVPLNAQ